MAGLTTVLALFIAIFVHTAYKSYKEPPRVAFANEKYFSEDYYQARHLFRQSAKAAKAQLHVIPYPYEGLDLSIDIAILPGSSPSSLIVHLSGTHGVEGFAGSAIQCAILSNRTFTSTSHSPTIAFVHAVNPYGFAKLRRYNEHNVDLNRNYLTPEQFKQVRARHPNAFGYEDLFGAMNPIVPSDISFWLEVGYALVNRGYTASKRAIVSGTYHHRKGLNFGGTELEPSHRLLDEFFSTHFDLASISHAAVLDVHTGLGPTGVDTIQLSDNKHAIKLFPNSLLASANEGALSGYDEVVGFASNGYAFKWFAPQAHSVGIVQEFGTVSSFTVLRALRFENAIFHHDPTSRIAAGNQLRDVFFLHDDGEWKQDVVTRGIHAVEQLSLNLHKISN